MQMRVLTAIAAVFSALGASAFSTSALAQGTIGWAAVDVAQHLRGQNGERFDFVCAPLGGGSIRTIYGTDIYTDTSPICPAAMHAGVITVAGGPVTIEILPQQASYQGTERNGVVSNAYTGTCCGSFRVVPTPVATAAPPAVPPVVKPGAPAASPPAAAAGATPIGWYEYPQALRGRNGELFVYVCPPLGDAGMGAAWGTDIYTDDSAICVAGVHAGAISTAGGTVTVEILPGQASYLASERNGISSYGYGSYTGSYRVVAVGAAK